MASSPDNLSMAVFCDFENVALGVRDAKYDKFDIKPVLERLLLKGSIVVKKAYCDWDRYKSFKAGMHEANFELIEIPHVRQSGKNSADIRLVVDALDLCYTKSHVNTFVIISGDSDFSPLVSKLRENAKQVIGVGIKQSTSDLLVANCDEFIFYDDLVRESRRAAQGRGVREAQPAPRRTPEEEQHRREEKEGRRNQAIEIAMHTFDALVSERGDSGKIWASMLKEAIKRRKPDFSESYYGFRTFGNLLEEAQARGLLEFGRDEKSNTYVYKSTGGNAVAGKAGDQAGEQPRPISEAESESVAAVVAEQAQAKPERRRSRGGRKPAAARGNGARQGGPERANGEEVQAEPAVFSAPAAAVADPMPAAVEQAHEAVEPLATADAKAGKKTPRRPAAAGSSGRARKAAGSVPAEEAAPVKPASKPAARTRRPRKTEAADE
ncbi:NYN domain-containing protein [Undibacterium sp. TJN25]|uniref:NYN domain-containing protein n=1 Tax=Undibacterium sp. TJN25 TaxID=3413056 RepID=UPI003BF40DB8